MKKRKKNTVAGKRFIKEFRFWQTKLQIKGYHVYFVDEEIGEQWATIVVDEKARTATVTFDSSESKNWPDFIAKHEACHLFLNKIIHLARTRFVTDEEILTEWENLSTLMEKLL